MKNEKVVTNWINGKHGKSNNGNLHTNGIDLFSYDMLIGATGQTGIKYALSAPSVSPTTNQHMSDARYGHWNGTVTLVTAVAGAGLYLYDQYVFPHDFLVTFQGHEFDAPSLPAPEVVRDPATDFHPGAKVIVHAVDESAKGVIDDMHAIQDGFSLAIRFDDINDPTHIVEYDVDFYGHGLYESISVAVTKPSYTKVVFRVWNNEDGSYGDVGNDVIALFPEIVADTDPATCESFMHVGQHGSANERAVLRATRHANKGEYLPLLRELEAAPYCYRFGKPLQRLSYGYYEKRRAELASMKTR